MILSEHFIWFILYGFMGWIYETTVMTIWYRKWYNSGILFLPICPIYGFGGLAISIIVEVMGYKNVSYAWKDIFLIAFFGSIVLEYFTGWILEKMFHAYWWDYSGVPFNIKGRICLPASLGFGVAGLLIVYQLYPLVSMITGRISPLWLEGCSIILAGMLAADTALTVSALKNFEKQVIELEESLNSKMDAIVEEFSGVLHRIGESSIVRVVKGLGCFQISILRKVMRYGSRNKLDMDNENRILDKIKKVKLLGESKQFKRGLTNGTKMARHKDGKLKN